MKKLFLSLALIGLSIFFVNKAVQLKPELEEKGTSFTVYNYNGLMLSFPALRSVVADVLYMEMCVKVGSLKEKIPNNEWKKAIMNFRVIHELDPYFFDPYYLEAAYLSWMIDNQEILRMIIDNLSEYGLEYVKDWKIPFYIGFIYFYFLGHPDIAAYYFNISSKMERAPRYLPLLAQRLYAKSGKYEVAIAVIEEELKSAKDIKMRKYLKKRLLSLKNLALISQTLDKYKKIYGRCPKTLKELVAAGYLKDIPKDPLGGNYYITDNCSIWTTNDLRESTASSR